MLMFEDASPSNTELMLKARAIRIKKLLRSRFWYRVTIVILTGIIIGLMICMANPHYL